jgi:hypothetical protein
MDDPFAELELDAIEQEKSRRVGIETDHTGSCAPVSRRSQSSRDFVAMNTLDNCGVPIDLRKGNHVRIRRSWRMPLAGQSGVISAIEPNDPCGTYLIQFKDGLQFRYERRDLELMVAPSTFHERLVRACLGLLDRFVCRRAV